MSPTILLKHKLFVFLPLEGEPVTPKVIFLFDLLYCNFRASLQCTLPRRDIFLPTLALPSSPSHSQFYKNKHTSKKVNIFTPFVCSRHVQEHFMRTGDRSKTIFE